MASRALAERIYRQYMTFFEKAERARRWSITDDLPWDLVDSCPRDPILAQCAETFCAVEMYLPDYVAQGINIVRDSFGQAWFAANWGYEESKHTLSLREYLRRTGQRTADAMADFESTILGRVWNKPFTTARQMTCYGMMQELTTYVIYRKHEALAKERGDGLLAKIYSTIARDEIAHFAFYADVIGLELEEDRPGTLRDLGHVFRNFTMPAHDLIPDYGERIELMRAAGVDRTVFMGEVWFRILKRLKTTRHEIAAAALPPT